MTAEDFGTLVTLLPEGTFQGSGEQDWVSTVSSTVRTHVLWKLTLLCVGHNIRADLAWLVCARSNTTIDAYRAFQTTRLQCSRSPLFPQVIAGLIDQPTWNFFLQIFGISVCKARRKANMPTAKRVGKPKYKARQSWVHSHHAYNIGYSRKANIHDPLFTEECVPEQHRKSKFWRTNNLALRAAVGCGNIAPTSDWGKVWLIIVAVVGVPATVGTLGVSAAHLMQFVEWMAVKAMDEVKIAFDHYDTDKSGVFAL